MKVITFELRQYDENTERFWVPFVDGVQYWQAAVIELKLNHEHVKETGERYRIQYHNESSEYYATLDEAKTTLAVAMLMNQNT